jgi:hypothetical protein
LRSFQLTGIPAQVKGENVMGSTGIGTKIARRRSAAGPQPKRQALFHRRDAELTEIGGFLDQELFTLRPQCLRGEFCAKSIPSEWPLENPKFQTISNGQTSESSKSAVPDFVRQSFVSKLLETQ